MMYQVLKATWENPIKNDFVKTCEEYLNILDIQLSFKEIEEMSQWRFKKLVKVKTEAAGLKYLQGQIKKQTKASNIEYCDLKIQEYFINGHCNKNLSKLIFKARSQSLDIKTQQKWKYADNICIGCKTQVETGEEILCCEMLNNENRLADIQVTYDWFYRRKVGDIVTAGKLLDRGMKQRHKILEAGIT